jgi:hypothetical protein
VLGVLAMDQRDKFTLVFVVGAMVISILMNITYLANDPGAHDNTELIEYLKQNNLTYGYSDFLTSNPLTVLSRGDVKILGANIDDNITMLNYLNEKLWYSDRPAFILWPGEDMPGYVRAHQPDEILIYENFKIYVYNSSMKFS